MKKQAVRRTEPTTLHFNLDNSEDAALTFHVALRDYPIRRHTPQTLRAAAKQNRLLTVVPVTHFIEDVPLPSDAIALTSVTCKVEVDGIVAEQPVSMAIHVPRAGRRSFLKSNGAPEQPHPKLMRYGVDSRTLGLSGVSRDLLIDTFQDAFDSAAALLFQHPALINLNAKDGGRIPAFILQRCIADVLRQNLGLVDTIEDLGKRWATSVPLLDLDGKPVLGEDGKQLFSTKYHDKVLRDIPTPLAEAIKRSQQFEELRGQQWTLQYGVTSSTYGARTNVKGKAKPSVDGTGLGKVAAGATNWTVRDVTSNSGLEVSSSVRYDGPEPTRGWSGDGVWSVDDREDPLTPELVAEILAGNIYLKVRTPRWQSGVCMGQLKLVGTATDDQPVEFTATLDARELSQRVDTAVTGRATFTLNATRNGLVYSLVTGETGREPATAVFFRKKQSADYHPIQLTPESGQGRLHVTYKNHWLRHLGAYVEFRDHAGKAIAPPGWNSRLPGFLQGVFEPSSTKKYLDLVAPVDVVFGVPLPADSEELSFPVPKECHTVRLHWGGLGRGDYDSDVCPAGLVFTVVIDMALPVILLVAGSAVMETKTVQNILKNKTVLYAILASCAVVVGVGGGTAIELSQNPGKTAKKIALALGPMLAKPAFSLLAKYLAQKIGEGFAKRAIPFINGFMELVNLSVTLSMLAQTSWAIGQSPFVYETDIERTLDLRVTLRPDSERGKKFPELSHKFLVLVVYDSGTTRPRVETLTGWTTTHSEPVQVDFSSIPAGGRLRVFAFFYAENGWQSGQGETAWMDAVGSGSTTRLDVSLEVKTNEIPLSKGSVYTHKQKIAYENGRHVWVGTKEAPAAVHSTRSPYPGKDVVRHVGITLAQSPAMVGYTWQATGLNVPKDFPNAPKTNEALYTFQNLSLLQDPQKQYAEPKVGFGAMTSLLYDMASRDDGSGRNFFIDTTGGEFSEARPAGGCHIRRVELRYGGAPPDFSTATNKSWGRFEFPMEKYIFHSSGYVLGISYNSHKVFVVELKRETSDREAPIATMISGEGFRDGLINGPRAIAVALDGRLLVLESGNNRIQAFDLKGNPAAYFEDPRRPGQKVPTMPLVTDKGDSQYLDLAVEAKGYLYVLAYKGAGGAPGDYRVDIYEPDGKFLVSTTGVAAAKIIVDTLRSMYALNYEVILGANGRPEPSVSMWLPPAPAPKPGLLLRKPARKKSAKSAK
jgi:hypothetical protein